MSRPIDIRVRLDAGTFRRYCAFDAFRRRRRWFLPALASMVLITISLAGILGLVAMPETLSGLLMGLGIAVPMILFGLYFIQIEAQVAHRGLKGAPEVYALRLDGDGIRVAGAEKPEASVLVPWSQPVAAFSRRSDVYLYVNPERALILPAGQASVSTEALWTFLRRQMGEEKCLVVR